MKSKAQIVATIGPASANTESLSAMMAHGLDVARLNFSWGTVEERREQIKLVRALAKELNKKVLILVDLPGPRVQNIKGHTYNHHAPSPVTEHDKEFIKFAVEHEVDYIGLSYVANAHDVESCRKIIKNFGGKQMIIAKIERVDALFSLDHIISVTDAVMVARGDLGNEVPLEQIPFVQEKIVHKAKKAGKPVIVATQMMLSMVEHDSPTRAEVTDVEVAIMQGADAVMLSEETAQGKYPVEAVVMMERVILEAEKHLDTKSNFNPLKSL